MTTSNQQLPVTPASTSTYPPVQTSAGSTASLDNPPAAYTPWQPPSRAQPHQPNSFPEPPHTGINRWIMVAAWWCKLSGLSAPETIAKIQSYEPGLRRAFKPDEVAAAVAKVFSYQRNRDSKKEATPNFPALNHAAQQAAINDSAVTQTFIPTHTGP